MNDAKTIEEKKIDNMCSGLVIDGQIGFVDYTPAKECCNDDVICCCLKCGRCGRVFDGGLMVDTGGTQPQNLDDYLDSEFDSAECVERQDQEYSEFIMPYQAKEAIEYLNSVPNDVIPVEKRITIEKALNKQIPKNKEESDRCPICGAYMVNVYRYCWYCGHRIYQEEG